MDTLHILFISQVSDFIFLNDTFCRCNLLSLRKDHYCDMSKQIEIMKRQLVILNKLSGCKKIVPTNELLDYVNRRMEERDGSSVNIRTIERDFRSIEELFNIKIAFNAISKGYYIIENGSWKHDRYEELLLNFELLTSIGQNPNLHSFVLAEHHRPANTHYLSDIITAIKSNNPIRFNYEYIRSNGCIREKKVNPHYLKEDQHRWYLLAIDVVDGIVKTFAVDAIEQLVICHSEHFTRDLNIRPEEIFRYSFGIWNQDDIPIEEIELSYSPLDGKFLKRLPLHHSQEILVDNENEFRIRVTLRITNDFVMALLARSASLVVIKPKTLRKKIRDIYEQALKRNL